VVGGTVDVSLAAAGDSNGMGTGLNGTNLSHSLNCSVNFVVNYTETNYPVNFVVN
jgi:hypothetical protein